MSKSTYLTFHVGEELFAVDVTYVLEVLEQQTISRVPKAPEDVLGIVNFRGDILPVYNSRKKFAIPDDEIMNKYIIVYELNDENSRYSVSATVDSVKDVIEFDDDEITDIPDMGVSYDVRFVRGVVKRDDKFIMIIDPEKVFFKPDMEIKQESELTNIQS